MGDTSLISGKHLTNMQKYVILVFIMNRKGREYTHGR